MKPISSTLAAAFVLASAFTAGAQTVVVQPEQETVIREYVKKKPLASISIPGVELNIGSRIPDTVELHSVEAPDVRYRYVVVDNRTLLIDPDTRQVVKVLN